MLKKILSCIIFYLILLQTVSAIGVGISPSDLNFSVQVGSSDSKSLFVFNTGTENSTYKVYVDKEYADWFDITPDNFTLSANEHKEVILKLKPPLSAEGESDFKAYAVSSSSSSFGVGSGIKIPVHISVSNSGIIGIMACTLLVLIAGAGIYIRRKRYANYKTDTNL